MSMKNFRPSAVAGALALVLALTLAAPVLAQDGPKVGIIDTEQILRDSTAGQTALAELTTLREQKEAQGNTLQEEVAGLQSRISEGRLSLSQDAIADLEKQLEDKAIALRRFEDDANRELTKKRQEVLRAVDAQVMPVINALGQEEGYDLIFRKFESGLIFASEGIDVTEKVIARLDAAAN